MTQKAKSDEDRPKTALEKQVETNRMKREANARGRRAFLAQKMDQLCGPRALVVDSTAAEPKTMKITNCIDAKVNGVEHHVGTEWRVTSQDAESIVYAMEKDDLPVHKDIMQDVEECNRSSGIYSGHSTGTPLPFVDDKDSGIQVLEDSLSTQSSDSLDKHTDNCKEVKLSKSNSFSKFFRRMRRSRSHRKPSANELNDSDSDMSVDNDRKVLRMSLSQRWSQFIAKKY